MYLYIIGVIIGLGSAGFFAWQALRKDSRLWPSAKVVYLIVGLMELYHAVIYGLVLVGALGVAASSPLHYGYYLRPVVGLYLATPLAIAAIHRDRS
jgi:hypothetical protein